jgi:phosphatidylglycerophosphate synthase
MALDLSGGAAEHLPSSRILVWCAAAPWRLAGLDLWRRAVYTAWRAGFERLLLVAEGGTAALRGALAGDPRLAGKQWDVVGPEEWPERVRGEGGRWVVLPDRWIVDASHLRELAAARGEPAAAAADGPFSADAEALAALAAEGWTPDRRRQRPARALAEPALYVHVASVADLGRAEDALFQSLARNTANAFARYVDRALSRAISRRLAPWPVTPNQITWFSITLGIVGALLLLRPTYGFGLLGCALFLASTIIDGCDGEIARLKFQESAKGAKLDVVGDNLVHAALFPCVALRAYFTDPDGPYLWLGAAALAGVLASWLAVYFVIICGRPSPRTLAFFEAFGNREFAYGLLVLAAIGKLQWFVWAMAIGLWVFPLGLVALRVLDR